MKKQDYISHVESRIASVTQALADLESKLADCASADEREVLAENVSNAKARIAFLAMIANEDCASIASAIKLSRDSLIAVERDAKALAKVAELFSALKQSRKISWSYDDALAQAIAYLIATDFADCDSDTLRRAIKSKRSEYKQCHIGTRQSDMILNMLERLNVATRKDNRVRTFDKTSEIVTRLNAIYA